MKCVPKKYGEKHSGWKKVPQTILASPYTPGQTWEKSATNHPGNPPPLWVIPIWKQHISQKGLP